MSTIELGGDLVIAPQKPHLIRQRLQEMYRMDDLAGLSDRSLKILGLGVWGAAGFVDTVEQNILNGYIQDPSWAGYASLWFSLSSTTPTEAGGSFTEPSGGAYARVSTAAADWGAASGTAPAVKSNTAAKSFPQASADWVSGANLTHFGLHDASTAGNLTSWGALTVPKPVLNGDTASLAIGAVVLKLGDPGDSY